MEEPWDADWEPVPEDTGSVGRAYERANDAELYERRTRGGAEAFEVAVTERMGVNWKRAMEGGE